MANAEEHGLVQQEAVGSRKGHSDHEIALNRRLATDISRQQNKTLGVVSVDAAQCYDCIAHALGSIACQRLGAPPFFLLTMLTCIQKMHFHLRTAYGDSDSFLGAHRDQGNVPFRGYAKVTAEAQPFGMQ